MDILISVTIVLAATAIFLGITRLLYPTKTDPEATNKNLLKSLPPPGPSPLFLPTLLYIVILILLAILTPLAVRFPMHKLPVLIPLMLFLALPGLAYAYLARFGYLTPPTKPPVKSGHRTIGPSDH
jgi:NADH:ubiquinone oxidoreductase subunit 3 (subunit A)